MEPNYAKGLDLLNKLHGGHSGEAIINALGGIAPKMVNITIEWVFGDLMQNPALDLKTRELAILAVLIPQGCMPQIKAHIEAALSTTGATQAEIIELITQTGIYAGFPTAVNAALAAKEVFEAGKI